VPFIVTSSATIICIHAGQVQLIPRQTTVLISGSPVLCEGDLSGAPIAGCAQPPSISSKPCTTVVSTIPGISSNPRVTVGGKPVLIQTLSGITDGVPPGAIQVVNPGQMVVQA
jgi:hypothetical protein